MRARSSAVLVAAALIAVACGPQTASTARPDQEASPAASPDAIVSLSPTATEMLFAIGAGEQVVAVDDQSDYPPEAPTTDLSGFEPNVEAIAAYEPDLVVISNSTPELERAFGRLTMEVLLLPAAADLEDTYDQIRRLGDATGHAAAAEQLIDRMQTDIDSIIASVPAEAEGATYYHELDTTYFSVTSETFIGEVYSLLGLDNIADAAKGSASGYPQLSPEYIIEADPDVIFLADTECCDQTAETVAGRPGWDQISAVKNDAVVELDDDIASRWGPRVVDLLEIVAEAVAGLEN